MTARTEFSAGAFLERGADLLFLLMLGAMIYAAVVYSKRRGRLAPRILGWSALVCLVVSSVRFGAGMMLEALRILKEPRETPDGPVLYETWALLGSLAEFLWGVALLIGGVAFVYVAWGETVAATRGRRRPPKSRKRA